MLGRGRAALAPHPLQVEPAALPEPWRPGCPVTLARRGFPSGSTCVEVAVLEHGSGPREALQGAVQAAARVGRSTVDRALHAFTCKTLYGRLETVGRSERPFGRAPPCGARGGDKRSLKYFILPYEVSLSAIDLHEIGWSEIDPIGSSTERTAQGRAEPRGPRERARRRGRGAVSAEMHAATSSIQSSNT